MDQKSIGSQSWGGDDNTQGRQEMEMKETENKRDEKWREKLMAFVPISFSCS